MKCSFFFACISAVINVSGDGKERVSGECEGLPIMHGHRLSPLSFIVREQYLLTSGLVSQLLLSSLLKVIRVGEGLYLSLSLSPLSRYIVV